MVNARNAKATEIYLDLINWSLLRKVIIYHNMTLTGLVVSLNNSGSFFWTVKAKKGLHS